MLERYTEQARRAIFFARYEAGLRAAEVITPLYLLLGLLREGGAEIHLALDLQRNRDAISQRILLSAVVPKKLQDLRSDRRLHQDAKTALAWAAEEANSDRSEKIRPIHLLRGLLCFPNEASSVLNAAGIELAMIRATAKEGRFRVPPGSRIRYQLWRLTTDSNWPALRGLALIFGFVILAILILHLFGLG